MTLPHSYGLALALTILTMLCWGSWANVLKIAKGWLSHVSGQSFLLGFAAEAIQWCFGRTFRVATRYRTFVATCDTHPRPIVRRDCGLDPPTATSARGEIMYREISKVM
jgi:hypothetical protein